MTNSDDTENPYTAAGDEVAHGAKQAVRAGNQLLVFHSEDRYGPYCTGVLKSGKKRCGTSLLMALGSGWEEVRIAGTDGSVTVPGTGDTDQEYWVRQRCSRHLDDERGFAAPDWSFFDPTRDADLICRTGPVWTPQGITGHQPSAFMFLVGQGQSGNATTSPESADDERADLLTRALATGVEPDVATALYRYYDEQDRLLYVGISDRLFARTGAHVLGSSWMDYAVRSTIARYPTREAAVAAETTAIKTERPLFNGTHNRTPEARARLVEYLIEHGRADLLAPSVSRG